MSGQVLWRLSEIDHSFHVPLILNEVGGIFYAPLAQLGEHSTFNRDVMGSSPIWGIYRLDIIYHAQGHIRKLLLAQLCPTQQVENLLDFNNRG